MGGPDADRAGCLARDAPSPYPARVRTSLVWLVAASLVACGDSTPSGRLPDATYIAVMGDLLRLDQARRSRPVPPWPGPAVGRLSSDTSWKAARRGESLKVFRADSAARAEVLATHGVTEAQLEATAMALVDNTQRSRVLWDSITKRASQPLPSPARPNAPGTGTSADTGTSAPRPAS